MSRARWAPLGAVNDILAASDETAGSSPLRSARKRGPLHVMPVIFRLLLKNNKYELFMDSTQATCCVLKRVSTIKATKLQIVLLSQLTT